MIMDNINIPRNTYYAHTIEYRLISQHLTFQILNTAQTPLLRYNFQLLFLLFSTKTMHNHQNLKTSLLCYKQ
jgi:hypothetical protein